MRPLQRRLFKTAHDDRQTLLEFQERHKTRITNHFQQLNANGPAQVILIACSAGKLDHPAPAKELYTGELFKKSKAYAEQTGYPYYILSACHGLLEPNETITPYNFTLKNQRQREREAWATRVVSSIVWKVPAGSTITILAGNDYADPMEIPLTQKGFIINRPLKGLAIGQQQQKLIALVRGEP
jgi:hypothetical protein